MKNIIGQFAVLFVLATLFAFTINQNQEVGTWTGTDDGKVGSVVFEEEGYAAFVIDGKTLGGKSFTQSGVELSMKYDINYDVTPIQVDFIFYSMTVEQEVARMKGILEFEGEKTMKLALNFDTEGANERPSDFDDENSVTLERVK